MYRKGASLAVTGVVILSFDAPLIRLISVEGWTVVAWRGFLMAVAVAVFSLLRPKLRKKVFALPGRGTWLAAMLFACTTVCFVLAAKLIPVSSVLTIVATVPISAAVLSRIFLGERLQPSLFVAAAGAILGASLVVRGDWTAGEPLGYAIAFLIVLLLGGYLTTLRSGLDPYAPQALALAGLAASAVGLIVGGIPYLPAVDVPYVGALGLVVVPVAFALIAAGAKYISAADVGMILVLELVFGVLWAWLFLGETLSGTTGMGVVLVLASLLVRARYASRRSRPLAVPVAAAGDAGEVACQGAPTGGPTTP